MLSSPPPSPFLSSSKLGSLARASHEKVMEKVVEYLIAAFGLIVGLAWNDAVKSLIEFLFPLSTSTLLAKFWYALLMTLLFVLMTKSIARFLRKKA